MPDAGTAGAHFSARVPWGVRFHLQFATHHLQPRTGVFAHVGGHHLANLLVYQQHAETVLVGAAVVRHHGQPGGAPTPDLLDQVLRDAAQAKAPAITVILSSRPARASS